MFNIWFFVATEDENKRNWKNLEEQIRNAGTDKDSKLITQNETAYISISSPSLSQKLLYLCNCSSMQVWFWAMLRIFPAAPLIFTTPLIPYLLLFLMQL